ncbi:MAG: hypothetical protein DMG00_24445 [Acidobacteria bacterium]|nr:MAG: hypothetical protein DMG00_24445 [Acidobacteriota bacterium]
MFSVILFGVIAVLMAIDVTIEIRSGVPLGLESFELVIFLLALGGIAIHWWRLTEARAEVKRWTEDARRWNQEAQDILQGLGVAIDRQFDRWGLSPAEREISSRVSGTRRLPSSERRASAPFVSRRCPSTENPASTAATISRHSSSKTFCCRPVRRPTYAHPAVER